MDDVDPDVELLARIGEGDPAAARELVSLKLPRVLSIATRMLGDATEARDVAQDTFERIWKQARRWKPGTARFDTWVYRVVLNLCHDRLRRRREFVSFDEAPDAPDPLPIPEEQLDRATRDARVAAALAALPARQREALILQYYEDFSNVVAADLMGISVAALESLLSRARRNLRHSLAQELDDSSSRKDQP